ncbi:MAG: DNA polymerase III subunit alpha, partial [bacterium]|nr:DNA polymerase III subunit alpha [bacterium]
GPAGLGVEFRPGVPRRPLLKFARETRLDPVATNNVHFLQTHEHALHRLLRAAVLNLSFSTLPAPELAARESWLKPPEEMERIFPECPEAIFNTKKIAEECRFEIPTGRPVFPRYDPGMDSFSLLSRLVYRGARERYGQISPVVARRIKTELTVIRGKGFSDYFLIVWDIVRNGSPGGITCGRGSAANSIVSYCLFITQVEPLKANLLFERFLNPEREDPPDLDVDFPWDEHDRVLKYVIRKFGPEKTARVSNHVTLKTRGAIRRIARVYGLPEKEITRFTERIPWLEEPGEDLSARLLRHPGLRDARLSPPWPEILELAGQVREIPIHLSTHCGGIIITPGPITDYTPVQRSGETAPDPDLARVTQWEKDQVEEAGLVKIDLLGNRSLAVIRDTLKLVERNTGRAIGYASLDPSEDEATRALFRRGETMGVFYTESPASRLLCRKSQSDSFDLLVLNTSIIRPAANRFIREYLARLSGRPYRPLHPLLDEVLSETFGIMVFQEDVTRVCVALAGMSPREADDLRKSLSKKKNSRVLNAYREKFFSGARARRIEPDTAEKIWEMILSFSGYSFCKGHSASYILVAQKSAYLRANHPAEFMAGVLANQGGYYSSSAYLSECVRMGLRILAPDVNESEPAFTGREQAIRIGLSHLKGIGEKAVTRIIAERGRGGRYSSFADFLNRTSSPSPSPFPLPALDGASKGEGNKNYPAEEHTFVTPAEVRVLIRAGALDSLRGDQTRPELLLFLELRERGASPEKISLPRLPEYPAAERFRAEEETLGFFTSTHPLSFWREEISRIPHCPARELEEKVGQAVTLVGIQITRKDVLSAKGEPMSFVTFEDETGLAETVLFPGVFRRDGYLLYSPGPFAVHGKVEEEFGAVTVNVRGLKLLTKARKPKTC